jgi:acyl-CoA reductase-like NAD-dependent aldehyde dehydrogenase
MVARKAAAALAAGCSIIVKPSEETPLVALALAELSRRAGFPPGVFNVVVCKGVQNASVVKALLDAPCVRVVSFTGSSAVGREVGAAAARALVIPLLELGGNAAAVVFDDAADVDRAAREIVAAKFRCAGQTCVSVNRVYVQEGVWDEFCAVAAGLVTVLGDRVGNGLATGVEVGPLIGRRAVRRIGRLVADSVARGAVVLVGGHAGTTPGMDVGFEFAEDEEDADGEVDEESLSDGRDNGAGSEGDGSQGRNGHGVGSETPGKEAVRMKIRRTEGGHGAVAMALPTAATLSATPKAHRPTSALAVGNFYMPTMLTQATPDMPIHNTEIFGPVLAVYRFSAEYDGFGALSTGCPTGSLAHYVYTSNVSRAARATRRADCGMVGLNVCGGVSDARVRFGGSGESGGGREGGEGALDGFCSWKYCVTRADG